MRFGIYAFLAAVLTFPLAVHADNTFTYPASSPVLSIAFPDSWKVDADPEDDNGLIATSADESIELDLWALPKHSDPKKTLNELDETAKGIAADIQHYVSDFKVSEKKEGSLNGIEAAMFGGTGKSKEDGEEVNVEVTLLSPDGKQIFAMMYWGSDEAEKSNQADLTKISNSLKKP